jgi:hypothetical protein
METCGARTAVIGGVRVCTLPKGHNPPEHNKGILVEGVDARFVAPEQVPSGERKWPGSE